MLAAALEIDRREARKLAGLPVPLRPLDVNPAARLVGVAALSAALMGLLAFVLVPAVAGKPAPAVDPVVAQAATLPKPRAIQVDVLPVYYAPRGRLIAVRLARQIGFVTRPLRAARIRSGWS